jgi:hypothetical protein
VIWKTGSPGCESFDLNDRNGLGIHYRIQLDKGYCTSRSLAYCIVEVACLGLASPAVPGVE